MIKKIKYIILLFVAINSYSQTNNESLLTAEGIAKIKVTPDLAIFRITATKENTIEKTAIKELNQEIQKLQNVLLKLGFTESNIKISEYNISKSNYNNKNEITVKNTLIINFVLNNKLIEAFYQEIQNESLEDLDIEFETQISEALELNTRQKLVKIAIDKAKNNAENMAIALNVKLNNVKKVSKYNIQDDSSSPMKVDEVKFKKPVIAKADEVVNTSFDKFQVEEIDLEETITIVYEIAHK